MQGYEVGSDLRTAILAAPADKLALVVQDISEDMLKYPGNLNLYSALLAIIAERLLKQETA